MYSYDLPYFSDSADLFLRIADMPHAIWLDSCHHGDSQGRYDIMSAAPAVHFRGKQGQLHIEEGGQTRQASEDTFTVLAQYLDALPKELPTNLPFCGGLMGYFGYELGMSLPHNTVSSQQPQLPLDDIYAGIYHWALVQDHQSKRCWLFCLQASDPKLREDLLKRCQGAEAEVPNGYLQKVLDGFKSSPFEANMSPEQYLQSIQKIDDYIHAGDCYQVNFAQRFRADFTGSELAAYLHLRQQLPSPYSGFMQLEQGAILSHSPERFLRIQGERVDTKPIKGTIARGETQEEDLQLAQQLQDSEKDRAENLMIVDLLRNDLSRSCKLGSVRVPRLFALESYRNVHHLVSTVSGNKLESMTPLDVLHASFPGGSVTGAPKKRAMEIIAELEPDSRSVYCGSLGYISANGNMDTSIAIRSLVSDGQGHLYCWGGGAITADSDPHSEYEESLTKVRILMESLQNPV